ncbi:hypothetical protein CEUSTIGMA_g4184.t1 [Chlamydomonas eustigma]|uniref:Proteasome assembly chaperone 3 n=1 Tax=Chlamydomonas eustigma TaxID=1157962 RepID=A0A250X0Y5_9CHLO|nr:hypothetical protein CEUSTIGMA_g4184.t1 [Chlamydomonas eustigma]|eukprot:GAX76737.1 hypothetical protein CEUSTIGMA_g4184.t1 [Chlamydomonas eustigma]
MENPLRINQKCVSIDSPEATIHIQIIDLGQQYYIWCSSLGSGCSNLHLGVNHPRDPSSSSVASLLPAPASSACESMARRLALRVGKPVLCSIQLPANSPMLQAIAEKHILKELTSMGSATIQS